MATPIRFNPLPRDPRKELSDRLDEAPIEHAEALLSGYEVLQRLHESGILDMLKGALGEGAALLETAVDVAKAPETIRSIRNLLLMGKLLGAIDPELLTAFLRAIPHGLDKIAAKRQETPTIFALIQKFNNEDSRRTMAMAAELLESIGKGLKGG
jgi:uncharacterized protein YjgD (DUF1641 family)